MKLAIDRALGAGPEELLLATDLAELSQPVGVSLHGSLWSELEPGAAAPQTGTLVSWQGSSRGLSPAERDEKLERRLRALGYVE